MKKIKILSLLFLTAITIGNAQEIDLAKKAMDAEQYENAKKILLNSLKAKPDNGRAYFLLGTIYNKQNNEDSSKIYFQRGLSSTEGANFNSIGLGQIDLEQGNVTAAKAKFDQVIEIKKLKKKDIEGCLYIAQAYMNTSKPDYKTAINYLLSAQAINPNDANVKLVLGDAYYGDKNQNDAYASYRDAYAIDNTLIRAKMQLGVLLKGAKAYDEAIKAFNEVIGLNANYGPVYRELAETYYYWANNKTSTYTDNIAKALSSYEKYMTLTDYSLSSRMRHADFLILAKDYKALELEANEMKKLDNVNPRILRYLGYSAYQNGNFDAAITSLTDYISKGSTKVIAGDYYFLGLSKVAKSVGSDGKTIDNATLGMGITDLKKALEMEIVITNGLNEIGKKYYSQKLYSITSTLFELAITNPNCRNYLEDNVYYGLSILTENRGKELKDVNVPALEKADKSMDIVIAATPNYQEAYLYKARINSSLEKDDIMAATYEKYLEIVLAKGDAEITKNKAKLIEAYNNVAAFNANTNVVKAKEYFGKTITLDPANEYAVKSLETLNKPSKVGK